jgi:cysteine-S-conjugate beta-lyase
VPALLGSLLLAALLAAWRTLSGPLPESVHSGVCWLDCGTLGLGPDPAAVLLRSGRIALTPGLDFGHQDAGFARLNIGTSDLPGRAGYPS